MSHLYWHTGELLNHFPWYRKEWCATPHCLRTTDTGKVVEILRVDLGGPSDHVARKCRADIDRRCALVEFKSSVRKKLFRLVVITATTEKAAAIQSALDRHLWPDGLQIHIAVVTNILPLLPRCQ